MDREPRRYGPADTAGPRPEGEGRGLWRELNQPHPFDPRALRIACSVLALVLGAFWLLRPNPLHAHVVPVRSVLLAYALAGAVLAPRLGWTGLRGYTVGLGILLPLANAYISSVFGNRPGDLPVTALATFVGMAFLQAGWDIVVVASGLFAGNLLLLAVRPPAEVPGVSVMLVAVGAIATGAAAGLVMQIYNALYRRSMSWWRSACERERALREFAELTAREQGSPHLLDHFAERFRSEARADRCLILLGEIGGGDVRVAGSAGITPADARAIGSAPLTPYVARLLWQLVEERRPLVYDDLPETLRANLSREVTMPVPSRSLVALPLTVEDAVAGAVVLTTSLPRPVPPDAVLLWQAMANQAGVAIANAQLLAQLRHALGAKSEFLNTMSHELRSPLHVIMGYADMLRDAEAAPEPGALAGRIRSSALELLQLVENTMNAARLDAGKVAVQIDDFALEDVVREVAEGVGALPEAKTGIPVRWNVPAGVPRLRLDRLKLKEIMQNLISNALKFTRTGAVSVAVSHRAEELHIAVRDTGPGIPREAQGRIFEMFERVEPMDGHRPAGIGLGLYIVRNLVHLMGGRIEVESVVGQGTCFTVRLPLRLAAAA
jgi:signal transduction histidine kinase